MRKSKKMSDELRIETVRGDMLSRWQIIEIRRLIYELYLDNAERIEKIVLEPGKKIRFSTFQKKHPLSSYSRNDYFYTMLIQEKRGTCEASLCGVIYGFFNADFNCNWLSSFYIIPECRGKGFGKKMFAEILQTLENRHPVHCEFNVITTNERAIALYRKFGFSTPVVYTMTNHIKSAT